MAREENPLYWWGIFERVEGGLGRLREVEWVEEVEEKT